MKKYQVLNAYPSQTVEKWLSDYKSLLTAYLVIPKSERNSYNGIELQNALNKIKSFLKTKKVKFI